MGFLVTFNPMSGNRMCLYMINDIKVYNISVITPISDNVIILAQSVFSSGNSLL